MRIKFPTGLLITGENMIRKLNISEHDILELIHFARRYCDGRKTGVAKEFNEIYDRIRKNNLTYYGFLNLKKLPNEQDNSHVCKFFPYAQDGDYDEKTGNFDAIPKK